MEPHISTAFTSPDCKPTWINAPYAFLDNECHASSSSNQSNFLLLSTRSRSRDEREDVMEDSVFARNRERWLPRLVESSEPFQSDKFETLRGLLLRAGRVGSSLSTAAGASTAGRGALVPRGRAISPGPGGESSMRFSDRARIPSAAGAVS